MAIRRSLTTRGPKLIALEARSQVPKRRAVISSSLNIFKVDLALSLMKSAGGGVAEVWVGGCVQLCPPGHFESRLVEQRWLAAITQC